MTRNTIDTGPATGAAVMANLNGHVQRLWDASVLPLTGVGGTANAITATLSPPLLAGLVVGMKFTLTIGVANTGPVTLSINGATAVPLLGADGVALAPGALQAGTRVLLERVGTAGLRVISGARAGAASGPVRSIFTASGTWVVPAGYADDTPVLLECWGGGGGGGTEARGAGGGGGSYAMRWLRYAELPSSTTIIVGAGGAPGVDGGSTSIGGLLIAYGGKKASPGISGGPGGGGVGASIFSDGLGWEINPFWGGGNGGSGGAVGAPGSPGGRAGMGGGGGGGLGNVSQPGGLSFGGGAGGAANVAGSVPAGGGGRNAAGGRGEARMTIFG